MAASLANLRAEAEALARALDSPSPDVRDASAVHTGSAGRRRAGSGERFWQFRPHAREDAPSRIDWRRSARGDALYVRETELETARTFWFWADPHPGFDWSGARGRVTKAHRARVILMAIAARLSRDGERVGVPGGQPAGFGGRALDRLGEDFLRMAPSDTTPTVPETQGIAIIASDFYDPLTEWTDRLTPLAARCRSGILLSVADPLELSFDWRGRVEFARPGTGQKRLVERAEQLAAAYAERLTAHQAGLESLAAQLGWSLLRHDTAAPALPLAHELGARLDALGARRVAA